MSDLIIASWVGLYFLFKMSLFLKVKNRNRKRREKTHCPDGRCHSGHFIQNGQGRTARFTFVCDRCDYRMERNTSDGF